jgi:hypothetical protein
VNGGADNKWATKTPLTVLSPPQMRVKKGSRGARSEGTQEEHRDTNGKGESEGGDKRMNGKVKGRN